VYKVERRRRRNRSRVLCPRLPAASACGVNRQPPAEVGAAASPRPGGWTRATPGRRSTYHCSQRQRQTRAPFCVTVGGGGGGGANEGCVTWRTWYQRTLSQVTAGASSHSTRRLLLASSARVQWRPRAPACVTRTTPLTCGWDGVRPGRQNGTNSQYRLHVHPRLEIAITIPWRFRDFAWMLDEKSGFFCQLQHSSVDCGLGVITSLPVG
jgi:hypothetical protein